MICGGESPQETFCDQRIIFYVGRAWEEDQTRTRWVSQRRRASLAVPGCCSVGPAAGAMKSDTAFTSSRSAIAGVRLGNPGNLRTRVVASGAGQSTTVRAPDCACAGRSLGPTNEEAREIAWLTTPRRLEKSGYGLPCRAAPAVSSR